MLWCLCLFKFYLNNTTNQNKTKEQQIKKEEECKVAFQIRKCESKFLFKGMWIKFVYDVVSCNCPCPSHDI